MDDAGGGGGYAGTYWWNVEVPYMWQVLENQDTTAHFEVVAGWGRTIDMIKNHISAVRVYKQRLADAWPPEKSAASAAYAERLQGLLDQLQSNHDAATANYAALGIVAENITKNRAKIQEIYTQYQQHEQDETDYETIRRASPETLIMPPSTTRKEELNQQARTIMYDISDTITSAHNQLTTPEQYDPSVDYQGENDSTVGASSTSSNAAVVSSALVGGASGGQVITPSSHSGSMASDARSIAQQAGLLSTSSLGGNVASGPVLGGVAVSGQSVNGVGSIGSGVAASPAGSAIPGSATFPGVMPATGLNPVGGSGARGGAIKQGGSLLPRSGSASPSTGIVSARPIGGVIGGSPQSGVSRSAMGYGGTQARGVVTRGVNPAGGIISSRGGGSSASPTPHTSSGNGPMGQQPGRHRDRRVGAVEHWDPDNPWEVAEGVAPVVLPSSEPGFDDPGPVIGYNR